MNIEESELSVMEAEGKARVHVKKTGYLKQFSMVSCRTQSHTAKSNRDTKQYDFVHTHTRLEFNEDESYKACDIVLNKDDQIEPIESFWVQLDEAKYSIIGLNSRIKVWNRIINYNFCYKPRLIIPKTIRWIYWTKSENQ